MSDVKYRAKANGTYGGKSFKVNVIYTAEEVSVVPPEKRHKFEPIEIVTIEEESRRLKHYEEATDDENINTIIELNKNISSLLAQNTVLEKENERLRNELKMRETEKSDLKEQIVELKRSIYKPVEKKTKKRTKK